MSDGICFAGLDVHARKIAAAAIVLGSGEVFRARLAGGPRETVDDDQASAAFAPFASVNAREGGVSCQPASWHAHD